MPRRHDRVPGIEITISAAVSRVDPNVLSAPDAERKLLVGRDLIVLFYVDYVF